VSKLKFSSELASISIESADECSGRETTAALRQFGTCTSDGCTVAPRLASIFGAMQCSTLSTYATITLRAELKAPVKAAVKAGECKMYRGLPPVAAKFLNDTSRNGPSNV
jgi:hypothetical protein